MHGIVEAMYGIVGNVQNCRQLGNVWSSRQLPLLFLILPTISYIASTISYIAYYSIHCLIKETRL